MTVKEIINELKKYDENLEVEIEDYCEMTRKTVYKIRKDLITYNDYINKKLIEEERIIING